MIETCDEVCMEWAGVWDGKDRDGHWIHRVEQNDFFLADFMYVRTYDDGVLDGKEIFYDTRIDGNQKLCEVNYDDGRLHGTGSCTLNNSTIQAEFEKGIRHGAYSITIQGKTRIEGQFKKKLYATYRPYQKQSLTPLKVSLFL